MVGLANWFQKKICKHRFAYEDLRQTGIKEIEPPKENSYEAWCKYYESYWTQEAVTKRVVWPCDKCGKKFYAHCGLDIINDNNVFWREHENKDREINTE